MPVHPPADESNAWFVAVGASGQAGLNDLKALLAALPAELPAVVLVVLHRPSDQISHLRAVLGRVSALPVLVPGEGDVFRAGACYVGEPDGHLALAARSRVRLVEGADNRYRNCTVDLLFSSIAAHARTRGVGVVLSGELSDGARGLAEIHHAGGMTMVLGARGAADHGMPRNATDYDGPIDFTGSVDAIAEAIVRRVNRVQPPGPALSPQP